MIDPHDITDFKRSDEELQQFMIFCVLVAGKTADTMARGLALLLYEKPADIYPFAWFANMSVDQLAGKLYRCGVGCFNNKAKTLLELARRDLNLRTCSVEDLEEIWGIGQKTSRFFLIHSRPNVQHAALDTHILKYMKQKRPTSKHKYLEVEREFLKLAQASGMSVANFDLSIWNSYAT